jgi:hypothetical protein
MPQKNRKRIVFGELFAKTLPPPTPDAIKELVGPFRPSHRYARARELGHETFEVLDRRNHFGIRQLKTILGRSCEAHRGITLTTFMRSGAWLSRV